MATRVLAAANNQVVIVDIGKVDRLALEIRVKISEYLDRESMTDAEIVLALNKAAYTITANWIAAQVELEKRGRGPAAA